MYPGIIRVTFWSSESPVPVVESGLMLDVPFLVYYSRQNPIEKEWLLVIHNTINLPLHLISFVSFRDLFGQFYMLPNLAQYLCDHFGMISSSYFKSLSLIIFFNHTAIEIWGKVVKISVSQCRGLLSSGEEILMTVTMQSGCTFMYMCTQKCQIAKEWSPNTA